MGLTETQKKLLDAICSRPGGVDIHEAMNLTGFTYPVVEKTAHELIAKGFQLRSLAGFKGYINRLFLSRYDRNYEQLMAKEGISNA